MLTYKIKTASYKCIFVTTSSTHITIWKKNNHHWDMKTRWHTIDKPVVIIKLVTDHIFHIFWNHGSVSTTPPVLPLITYTSIFSNSRYNKHITNNLSFLSLNYNIISTFRSEIASIPRWQIRRNCGFKPSPASKIVIFWNLTCTKPLTHPHYSAPIQFPVNFHPFSASVPMTWSFG